MIRRILLRNGTLIDGTGQPPFAGDVLISEDRIADVGCFECPTEAQVFDCAGLVISPGFIDAHSHSDLQVLENRPEKVLQGVTAEVVGNCGFSPYPARADRKLLQDFANGIFCGDDRWGWASVKDYLAEVNRKAALVNVFSLAGHGSLRIAQVGHRLGPLAACDLDALEQSLSEALSEGACGFSTGLMYSPGASAPFEELERLCRIVAKHGKIYATHMRSYTAGLLEAVDEQLELARRTACRLEISHFQAAGPGNWGKQQLALEKIEKARLEGLDVGFDCYPYAAGSTVLTQLLPQWSLEGGIEALMVRLRDAAQRKRIGAETVAELAVPWTNVYINGVGSNANRGLIGKSIAAIAELRGREPVDVMMDLLCEERGQVNIVEFLQSRENLRQTLSHPLSVVISDGFYVKGRPHPRLYGTFPLLLGEMCRNREWLRLTEAVHKITGLPALRFGLERRGRLAPGFFADITVFDASTIQGSASYETPEIAPVGIRYVFRNGRLVVLDGRVSA